ncbi:hypothetical protein ACFLVB_00775 [Chloroflexota bacterium]
MDSEEERIEYAAGHTEILRLPKQRLSTFGTTNVYYYLISEPVYPELERETGADETVIREGRVIAEKPKIVTPYYMTRLEGFSTDAKKYFDKLSMIHGPDAPGLLYAYKNEAKTLNIVSDNWLTVARRINDDIEQRGDQLTSIIKGEDFLWDVSLMKFIYEMTRNSLQSNLSQLGNRGLLNMDSSGLPADARLRIEEFFRQVIDGEREPQDLKAELDQWNVFAEYEDRFLSIFKRRN